MLEYNTGDVVPASGIYNVLHDCGHPFHQITCIENKHFPPVRQGSTLPEPCEECNETNIEKPTFKLFYEAIHIADGESLKAPSKFDKLLKKFRGR